MRENRSSLIGFMSRVDGIAKLTANVITVADAERILLHTLSTSMEGKTGLLKIYLPADHC